MDSWLGHHYNELIAGWGMPQQVFDDGKGGKILAYIETNQVVLPGSSRTYTTGDAVSLNSFIYGSATSRTTYNPPQVYSHTKQYMFWINKDGYIYYWAVK